MSILGNTKPAFNKNPAAPPPGMQMPQWYVAGSKGQTPVPAGVNPLDLAKQAQAQALYQASIPGPANGSWTELRGDPIDFDQLLMSMMTSGGQQPGREDPKPGSKPPPGGGGGGPGAGMTNNAAPFSWEQWDPLPGVKPYDMGSILAYMGRVNAQDPNDKLDWGKVFRTGAGGRQNR